MSATSELRLRRMLLVMAGAWTFFGLYYGLQGYRQTAVNDLVCALGNVVLFGLVGRLPGCLVASLASALAVVGLVMVSIFSGQAESMAPFYFVGLPMFAATTVGARGALVAGLVSTAAILVVHLSAGALPVTPEFTSHGWELAVLQIGLTMVIMAFSVYSRLLHDRQLATLQLQAAELSLARDQALAAAETKSRFLANMSHEIRTPLNGVLGMASMLGSTELEEEQRQWVDTLSSSGNLLLAIVNDILDFSKLDAGQLRIEAIPFDVRAVVYNAVDLVVGAAWEKGLELTVQVAPDVPAQVEGDPLRVGQVLLNLLSNAVKFTAQGEVAVRVEATGDGLEFAVQDSGIGIPPEQVGGLFAAFHQVDASTSRKYGGTGLGLSISQRLAQLMDGDIRVESTPGVGSTFRFRCRTRRLADVTPVPPLPRRLGCVGLPEATLENLRGLGRQLGCTVEPAEAPDSSYDAVLFWAPAAECAQDCLRWGQSAPGVLRVIVTATCDQHKTPHFRSLGFQKVALVPLRPQSLRQLFGPAGGSSAPEPGERPLAAEVPLDILVAEDNAVNVKVITSLLIRLGYAPVVVGNGQLALEALRERPFDLVLMDMQMPEMDGLEATRRIREEFGSRPRVVALTANVLAEQRQEMLQAGADGFLGKPIVLPELRAALLGQSQVEKP